MGSVISLGLIMLQVAVADTSQLQVPDVAYISMTASSGWPVPPQLYRERQLPYLLIDARGNVTINRMQRKYGGEPISGTGRLADEDVARVFTSYVVAFGMQAAERVNCEYRYVSVVDGSLLIGGSQMSDGGEWTIRACLASGSPETVTVVGGMLAHCPCDVSAAIDELIETAISAVDQR